MPVLAAAALNGLAGVAFALMLLASGGAALSLWSLARLRRDYRIAEAAERLEAVSLNYVVRRYVPRRQRSHRRAEEVRLVKQTIDRRRLGYRLWAVASAAVVLCSAVAGVFFLQHNLRTMAPVHAAARVPPSADPLAAIQGVWGWRADSSQSCAENPQTVSVSPDRRSISVRYAKAAASSPPIEFNVVSTQPYTLVLSPLRAAPAGRPVSVVIKFLDLDTYIASNSDQPMQTTGVIERCRQGAVAPRSG